MLRSLALSRIQMNADMNRPELCVTVQHLSFILNGFFFFWACLISP